MTIIPSHCLFGAISLCLVSGCAGSGQVTRALGGIKTYRHCPDQGRELRALFDPAADTWCMTTHPEPRPEAAEAALNAGIDDLAFLRSVVIRAEEVMERRHADEATSRHYASRSRTLTRARGCMQFLERKSVRTEQGAYVASAVFLVYAQRVCRWLLGEPNDAQVDIVAQGAPAAVEIAAADGDQATGRWAPACARGGCALPLPRGHYAVRIGGDLVQGPPVERRITVDKQRTVRVQAEVEPILAEVALSGPDGAVVLVGGAEMALLPSPPITLAAGGHEVALRHPCFESTPRWVMVGRGDQSIALEAEPRMVTVEIETHSDRGPLDQANVLVDGTSVGTTSRPAHIPFCAREITVHAQGFETWSHEHETGQPWPSKLVANLQPRANTERKELVDAEPDSSAGEDSAPPPGDSDPTTPSGLDMDRSLDASLLRPKLVHVPAGTFQMGSPEDEGHDDEHPRHWVRISYPLLMAETEVTQAQWRAVMKTDPSYFSGCDNCPVERVSWYDAVVYCNELSSQEGLEPCYELSGNKGEPGGGCPGGDMFCDGDHIIEKVDLKDLGCNGYRLPTEAEWEYACRAGTETRYWSGDTESDLARTGWYDANSGGKTHPVGEKREPHHPWGLLDMHGNVWEWCNDWWHPTYEHADKDRPVLDPKGPPGGFGRVFRGGSFRNDAGWARSANRGRWRPRNRSRFRGFRVVRPVVPEPG